MQDIKMITFKSVPNSVDAEATIESIAGHLANRGYFSEYAGESSIKLKSGAKKDIVRTIINNVLEKRGYDNEIKFALVNSTD